jgi:phosphate uptake regulator
VEQITRGEPASRIVRDLDMASDVLIPGDALADAASNMRLVLQHIDVSGGATFEEFQNLGSVVGEPLHGSAAGFENHWKDGRKQLHRECQKIIDAIDKITDGFQKTDDQAASGLDQKS